jgi:hypothetical protein
MNDHRRSNSSFGMILGGLVLVALAFFVLTGGQHGGTKKVQSDADLPQVTSPKAVTSDENTGSAR